MRNVQWTKGANSAFEIKTNWSGKKLITIKIQRRAAFFAPSRHHKWSTLLIEHALGANCTSFTLMYLWIQRLWKQRSKFKSEKPSVCREYVHSRALVKKQYTLLIYILKNIHIFIWNFCVEHLKYYLTNILYRDIYWKEISN